MTADNRPGAARTISDSGEDEQATASIQPSISRLSATIESAADGILAVDRKGKITHYNQKYLKLWGIPEPVAAVSNEEIWMASMLDQVTDPPAFLQCLDELSRRPEEESFDLIEFKDGRIYELYSQPQRIDGEITGRVWSFRDSTALRREYEAMRESEEKCRLLFENVTDVVYSIDRELKVTAVSPSVERQLGYRPEELIGKHVHEVNILAPGHLAKAIADMKRVFSGERISCVEYEFIAKDGTKKFGEVSGAPISRDGSVVSLISVGRDITDRKRAEEELRKSDEKFHALFLNMQEGVALYRVIHGDEGRAVDYLIEDVNPAYEKQTGISRDKAKGMLASRLYGIDAIPLLDTYESISRTGEPRSSEIYFPTLNRHFELSCFSLGEGWFTTVISDITARERTNRALAESLDRLRKALESTVQAMAVTVETRDPYTAGHQRRAADLACAIAREMELNAEQIDCIRMAASIHDIGKISVPAEILSKPTILTQIEFNLIKTHSQSGYDILRDIQFPWPIARVVLEHHERMDGSGYPYGLTGDALLLESRVLVVADVVEAIASNRPYRPAHTIEAALNEISENRSILYDADVVTACLKLFQEKRYALEGNELMSA